MSARRRFALVLVGGILLSLSGMFLGLWWVTFATGVAIGLALPRTWTALVAGAISGLVAWSEPLIEANAQYGLGPTSLSIAAIMGANGAALIPIALTVIVGVLLVWRARGSAPRCAASPSTARAQARLRNSVTSDWK